MNKTSMAAFLLLFGLPALVAAAAAETVPDIKAAPAKIRARCVFPDNPRQTAPAWVCSKQAPGVAVAAVGWHKKSKAGVQFTKDQAAASARLALAQAMTQQLGRKLRGYAATHGSAPGAADKVVTPALEQRTQQTLTGSRIVQQATSRKGTIYVLVGIDAQQADQATREVVRGAAAAEPALWRALQGGQSGEELAAAIAAID